MSFLEKFITWNFWKRFLIISFKTLLILIVLMSIIPYFIPTAQSKDIPDKPYSDSTFTTIDGISLHYRFGSVEKSKLKGKIIFVHGVFASTFSWRKNLDFFRENGYVTLAVDLPGFGYSDRKEGLDHSQIARAKLMWKLMELIDEQNPDLKDLKWNIVGHSMGGGTITYINNEHQDRVENMVIVDDVFTERSRDTRNIIKVLDIFPPLEEWVSVFAKYYFIKDSFVRKTMVTAYGREPLDEEVKGYLEPLEIKGTVNSVFDLAKSPKSPDLKREDVTTRTLIIWGDKDPWVNAERQEVVHKEVKNSTLKTIAGAAHSPMETHPEEFNKALLEFFTSK